MWGCREQVIHQKFPDIFVQSGIMERGNFSAAAGFGMAKDRQVRARALPVRALPQHHSQPLRFPHHTISPFSLSGL
jgi:hypothetical protein